MQKYWRKIKYYDINLQYLALRLSISIYFAPVR